MVAMSNNSKVTKAQAHSPNASSASLKKAGKWSVEEEKYAFFLIDEFDRGNLNDCLEGTTLRAYLAKKLNCSPMRISKKFAGLCIGKNIYTSHANLNCDRLSNSALHNDSLVREENVPTNPTKQLNCQTQSSHPTNDRERNLSTMIATTPPSGFNQFEYVREPGYHAESKIMDFRTSPERQDFVPAFSLTFPTEYFLSGAIGLPSYFPTVNSIPSMDDMCSIDDDVAVSQDSCSIGGYEEDDKSIDNEAQVWKDVLDYYVFSCNSPQHHYDPSPLTYQPLQC